jgi:hypothetical protein
MASFADEPPALRKALCAIKSHSGWLTTDDHSSAGGSLYSSWLINFGMIPHSVDSPVVLLVCEHNLGAFTWWRAVPNPLIASVIIVLKIARDSYISA